MDDARGSAVRRFVAGSAVSSLGAVLLFVPLYDIWDDVTNLEWQLSATVLENATLLLLAGGLVVGGLWLVRSDWDTEHVTTVATWNVIGTIAAAVLFGWIVFIQRWAMHGLKPLVIALDGVLLGAVTTFGVGVYSAKRDRERERLRAERNRFAGLFENTSDAVAAVALNAEEPMIETVNDRFERTFGHDSEAIFEDTIFALDEDYTRQDVLDSVSNGETVELTINREIEGKEHDYVVRFVPYGAEDGDHFYVVVTDITAQQELARQQEANDRLESLHAFVTDLQTVDTAADAHELAVDAVDELLSPEAVRLVVDGETVAGTGVAVTHSATSADDPRFIAQIGGRGRIEVFGSSFAEREVRTVELLGTHLDRALERLDREEQIQSEREQLEFINRIVRHNLLNSIQLVRGRLEHLDGESFESHRDTIVDRVDEMADFIQTMRAYMQALVEGEEHELWPVELQPTVREEVESARSRYTDAEIDLGEIPDVTVRADDLLGPIVENLLANAVEHNDKDTPRVRVDAELGDGMVTVRVADNGPGVPDDREDEIFERGEFGERSSGSGFGLYLVQTAVDSYGGSVEIVDNEPVGSVFQVTLPLASEGEQSA